MNKLVRMTTTITLLLLSVLVWGQTSPIPMLQETSDHILAVLQQNKPKLAKNPSIIYHAVQQYMVPHVDVEGMSRSVLGRQAWMSASASDRNEFKQVFTQLVIRTYASPLAEYSNETVEFSPIRGQANNQFVRVNSTIIRPSARNIALSYSLINQGNQWKIYDLSVEGVSLLQSFHSQFAEVLQPSSMKDLIKEMRQRAAVVSS